MPTVIAWLEIAAATLLLVIAFVPFSGYCAGRTMGLDCESQAIFAVNLVGPLGIVLLIAGIWLARTSSWKSQFVLAVGIAAIGSRWLSAWVQA